MVSNLLSRGPQEPQHKHKEETRKLQANFDKSSQHHKEELQGLKAQHLSAETGTASASAGEQSPQISRKSSLESLSSDSLPDVNKDFTDEASRESVSSRQRESVLLVSDYTVGNCMTVMGFSIFLQGKCNQLSETIS